jgi:predicted AlkP superfamily pyrophosphatase or phosphodiesterase
VTARAVLLVLDGLPHRHVNLRVTPNLVRLAEAGGMAPAGGRAVLTSATYPNHATLVTGADPGVHGLTANFVVRDGAIVAADTIGPAVPTVFDLGVATAAVYGDQHLVGVTGARRAGTHWPPDGIVPDDAVRTTDNYIADETTVTQLVAALSSDADLVVAQLNGPDTAGHAFGPDTEAAADAYRATDRCLTDIVEALRPRWDETFLAVVSDHDQVTVTEPACIDLWSPLRESGLDLTVVPEGEAAVIIGADPTAGGWLDRIAGVAGHQQWYDGSRLAWAEPGRVFGWGEATLRGIHGGPATRTQVAVVAGGHPLVREVAASITTRQPGAEDWAHHLAAVTGVRLARSG